MKREYYDCSTHQERRASIVKACQLMVQEGFLAEKDCPTYEDLSWMNASECWEMYKQFCRY